MIQLCLAECCTSSAGGRTLSASPSVRRRAPGHEHRLELSHGGQGAKRGFGLITYTNYSTSDYNGFYFGESFESPFNWSSPPKGVVADYEHEPVPRSFANLREFTKGTGQDAHSIMFDPASFMRFTMPNKSDISYVYPAERLALEERLGSDR